MIKKKADKANLLFFSNSAIEKLESEIDTVLKLLKDLVARLFAHIIFFS
jgi:hypothetical protein